MFSLSSDCSLALESKINLTFFHYVYPFIQIKIYLLFFVYIITFELVLHKITQKYLFF